MDRKTLEYMEERAKKARKIVFRIDELTKKIKTSESADKVFFNAKAHGFHVEEYNFDIVTEMKKAFKEIVSKEIERLEQELAEL